MIRVANSVEKNCHAVPPSNPIAIPNATSTNVLEAVKGFGEIASRYVQNVGTNPVQYSYGCDSDGISYHGVIAVGQQFNASDCPDRLSVWCPTGSSIVAVTIIRRNDMTVDQNIL